ncbi:MAG: SHOCT domain-containing protein [Pseudonocardiaceae bacterium]
MMMDGWAFGWMWVWPVLVLAGLMLLVYGVVRLVAGGSGPDSSAQRILDERYARGELDEEEYRRRRAQLR